MKHRKAPIGRFVSLGSAILFFGLFFIGCDLFNARLDEDVARKIDDAVKVANAPEINVEFDTGNHGSFQQRPAQVKQGVPFTVSFDPYVGYYFVEWRAYRDAVQDDNLLTGAEVAFANQNERQTQITVNVSAAKIIVRAYTDTSPSLLFQEPEIKRFSSTPANPLILGDIFPNTYVRFIFTKPMDPASFTDSTVLITEKSSSATNESNSRNSWYERPVFSLDRTRVTFYRYPSRSTTPGRGYPIDKDYPNIVSVPENPTDEMTYTITLTGELRSEAGFPVGRDMALRYTVKGYGTGNEAANFDLICGKTDNISASYFFITKSALDKSDPKNRFIFKDMPQNENNTISPQSEEKIYVIAAIGTDTAQPLRRILISEAVELGQGPHHVFGAYCEPLEDDNPEKTRVLDALRKKAAADVSDTASILKNVGYVFAYSPNVCYVSGFPGTPVNPEIQIKIALRTWADGPEDTPPPDRGYDYEVTGEGMTYYIGGM